MKHSIPLIAGMDEAGRGPWAGPVVASAVILAKGTRLPKLRDSKKLNEIEREILYEQIIRKTIWGIGMASNEEIDHFGLRRATQKAFRRALNNLPAEPHELVIDGRDHFNLPYPATYIIKGDDKVRSISAASILAKVTRDRIMVDYGRKWPQYGFRNHKGYGTRHHQENLHKFGVTTIHRKSYRPVQIHL